MESFRPKYDVWIDFGGSTVLEVFNLIRHYRQEGKDYSFLIVDPLSTLAWQILALCDSGNFEKVVQTITNFRNARTGKDDGFTDVQPEYQPRLASIYQQAFTACGKIDGNIWCADSKMDNLQLSDEKKATGASFYYPSQYEIRDSRQIVYCADRNLQSGGVLNILTENYHVAEEVYRAARNTRSFEEITTTEGQAITMQPLTYFSYVFGERQVYGLSAVRR